MDNAVFFIITPYEQIGVYVKLFILKKNKLEFLSF
jgi:hypothetical protein